MIKKKKGLILTIVALLGLIVITAGVTYAFFNYTKQGTTENTVTTGTITFLYTEVSGVGRGISINDAYPISDETGKVQTGEGKVFDFKVTSTTPTNSSIPYEITARKKVAENMLDEEAVKLYLTKVSGDSEEEVMLDNYSNLTQTTKVSEDKYIEKTLHTDKVPAGSTNYEQTYRLRMWIDEDVDFSPNEDGTYPYNNKAFTVTVNVYANAKVVTDEDIANESKAEISSLSIDGTELTAVEGQDYNYEASLPEGTTSTTINVETISEYATVTVEKIDSLAIDTSNIKRLSTKRTLELNPGDNYFKITVTSENKEVENEYMIKITVKQGEILLSDAIFNKYTTIYENPTLTDSSNNTTDASGLYKSNATNFNGVEGTPTYYFRGNVENYVDFAGFTWRVVRINEDGTIRLISDEVIGKMTTNTNFNNYTYMYFSNSNIEGGIKKYLDNWYNTNIQEKNYDDKVVTGNYFCEQAKVRYSSNNYTGNANMEIYSSYVPTFTCKEDGNGKGLVNTNIGLITYDEVSYAGGFVSKSNNNFYLSDNGEWWLTMSPAAMAGAYAAMWGLVDNNLYVINTSNPAYIYPVINLKADVTVTGTGASDDHWVVQ